MQQPGPDVGRRMVVARSNCSRTAVEPMSNRSCNHRVRTYKFLYTDKISMSAKGKGKDKTGREEKSEGR